MNKHSASVPDSSPVDLPLVVLTVALDGTMTAIIDGTEYEPEPGEAAWTRASFPQIIDHASHDRTRTIRVEVHEVDGSTFTDVIAARPRPPALEPDVPEPVVESRSTRRRRQSELVLVEITGDGFIPGEDISCALILTRTDAAPDGTARALIDTNQLTAGADGTVLLVGHVSGTVITRALS
ncbi:hypothetical protein [Paramicrobacterium fandaimingii]|uniref:hypothetical protein n=1 Tax=Paramicrobacterium fandaimingii TaxID=2708079 RepID=UPI0014203579|nr:hypothetical protein [Microbacterium fandaimingii]